jgi:hypothetical protein
MTNPAVREFFTFILINGTITAKDTENLKETYFGLGMDSGWLSKDGDGLTYRMTKKGIEELSKC